MRVIGLALAGGVTIFALVAWLLHREGEPTAGEGSVIPYIWIAVATTLIAASMVWWRGNVVPLIGGDDRGDWRRRAAGIQTGVIVSWALVEAAALFGVVVYFLEGTWVAAGLGVGIMWAALALTWPRVEWLDPERAPSP